MQSQGHWLAAGPRKCGTTSYPFKSNSIRNNSFPFCRLVAVLGPQKYTPIPAEPSETETFPFFYRLKGCFHRGRHTRAACIRTHACHRRHPIWTWHILFVLIYGYSKEYVYFMCLRNASGSSGCIQLRPKAKLKEWKRKSAQLQHVFQWTMRGVINFPSFTVHSHWRGPAPPAIPVIAPLRNERTNE